MNDSSWGSLLSDALSVTAATHFTVALWGGGLCQREGFPYGLKTKGQQLSMVFQRNRVSSPVLLDAVVQQETPVVHKERRNARLPTISTSFSPDHFPQWLPKKAPT